MLPLFTQIKYVHEITLAGPKAINLQTFVGTVIEWLSFSKTTLCEQDWVVVQKLLLHEKLHLFWSAFAISPLGEVSGKAAGGSSLSGSLRD